MINKLVHLFIYCVIEDLEVIVAWGQWKIYIHKMYWFLSWIYLVTPYKSSHGKFEVKTSVGQPDLQALLMQIYNMIE